MSQLRTATDDNELPVVPRDSTDLTEALAQLGNEQLGLLKRGEVTAFRNLVPIEEPRVGPIAPHLRRVEKVAFEYTHRNRQLERHSHEILPETLVIQPRRGCGGVGQPAESNAIQHVVDGERPRGCAPFFRPSPQLFPESP